MRPGPPKRFDPEEALERARDLFWRRGYDGTGIRELEATLGIGRKSLYDTYGSKRELYLRALQLYADTVIGRICEGLERPGASAMESLERVLERLGRHHGSDESLGCLLGVAMAQADREDAELAELLRRHLQALEQALERAVGRAQAEGAIRADAAPRDVARHLVALVQGVALLGRVGTSPARQRSAVRAALDALRA